MNRTTYFVFVPGVLAIAALAHWLCADWPPLLTWFVMGLAIAAWFVLVRIGKAALAVARDDEDRL